MSDRKYRHQGYQDNDRNDRPRTPRRPSGGPKKYDGAPGGRGLGAPTVTVFKCAVCGHEKQDPSIGIGSTCSSCGKDLRTCTNCSFFNTGHRFECTKTLMKRVEDKTKNNDCNHFSPKIVHEIRGAKDKPKDARAAFDALFKK